MVYILLVALEASVFKPTLCLSIFSLAFLRFRWLVERAPFLFLGQMYPSRFTFLLDPLFVFFFGGESFPFSYYDQC